MVGCFILLFAIPVVIGLISFFSHSPLRLRPPKVGPHVPIPIIDVGTLAFGRSIYLREDCGGCHTLTGANPQQDKAISKEVGASNQNSSSIPDLTHEGRRNADIGWQMSNLREHRRIYPNSMMADYSDLSPSELKALASYLATRR
jgi:cbb3-type cytochrome oxidase cytochrome c subunit